MFDFPVFTIIMDLSFFLWDEKPSVEFFSQAMGIYEASTIHSTVINAVDEAFKTYLKDAEEASGTEDARAAKLVQEIQDIVVKNRLCEFKLIFGFATRTDNLSS